MSRDDIYSSLCEVEKTDRYTLSVVKTADTGMLGLVYSLQGAQTGESAAIVKSAIKRAKTVKHSSMAKVLEAGKGEFLTVVFPGERLDRVVEALKGVDRSGLPPFVAASIIHDIASALAALHDAGLAFGPAESSQMMVGYSGKSKLFGMPLSALSAHRAGKSPSAFLDTQGLGALLGQIVEEGDAETKTLKAVAQKAEEGEYTDADELVEALDAWLGARKSASHDEVRGWLRRRFPDRFTLWRAIAGELRGDGDKTAVASQVALALKARIQAIAPTAPPTSLERSLSPTDGPRELLPPPILGGVETVVGGVARADLGGSVGSTDSMLGGSAPDHEVNQIVPPKGYRIERLLGVGGMGKVFGARQESIDRPVALKFLHPHLASDPLLSVRFAREAASLSKLRHPNVVTVYDAGNTPDGRLFYAMELLQGVGLDRMLADKGAFDLVEALNVIEQVCTAVVEAHRQGIVHRDLKPENIHLDEVGGRDDLVKVLDFGIVKLLGAETTPSSSKTVPGSVFGTPKYMSPEQADGKDMDHRVDIYAMGIILFELLVGEVPFDKQSLASTLMSQVNDPMPKMSDRNPMADLTPEVEALVARATMKERDKRYDSAEAMLEEIRQIQMEVEAVRSSVNLTAPTASQRRRAQNTGNYMALPDDGEEPAFNAAADEEGEREWDAWPIDDLLEPLSATAASGDPTAVYILEVVRCVGDAVMSSNFVHVNDKFKFGSTTIAKMTERGARVTLPLGATGTIFRHGRSEALEKEVLLELGDRAEVEIDDRIFRFRVDRAAREAGRATGERTPYKLYAMCLGGGLALHIVFFLLVASLSSFGIKLTVDEPVEDERFAHLKPPSELKKKPPKKKKKKPKKKKKRKLIEPKKKKKEPKKDEKQPVVKEKINKILKNRKPSKHSKVKDAAERLALTLTDPDDSDSPSVSDLRANVDAVRGSSGAFAVAGSLGVGGGNEINVAGGSGPVVTRGGAGKGTGKLSGRKRGKKVRGKVKAFKALSKVRGTIDKAAVYKAISKHMHKIQRCYERQVMKKGNLSGKVTAEWSIGTNGRVKRAKIKLSTLNSRKVDSCLLKVIKKIKFPKPKGGDVIVVYPFIFSLAR